MHEITKTTTVALAILVLATTGLTEVCDRGEFSVKRSASIPALVQFVSCILSLGLPLVARIDVANEVIAHVVAHVEF